MKISSTWKLILLYSIIALLLAFFMPRQLDWNPSFSEDHNKPYGGEAMYGTLGELFSEDIKTVDEPLYNVLKDTLFTTTNYVIVNTDFYVDSLDLSALYGLVANGNNALISAENFNREFLDSLGVSSETHFNNFMNLEELNAVSAKMYISHSDTSFSFKSQWSNTYFEVRDSANRDLLGIGMQDTLYNFVKVPYGKGNFYLHSFPYALTNYYLMKDETRDYIAGVFSHLPENYDLVWDEYYKPSRNAQQRSPLSVLMRYPSFRWAYWLTIVGLFLFIVFYAKRKQRPIPIVTSPRNESLRFVETLGGLYYNKGSHKDIFIKKMKVFKEYISTNFFMKDLEYTAQEAEILAMKSGRDRKLIDQIFEQASQYEELGILSDAQLKAIIKRINKFYFSDQTELD